MYDFHQEVVPITPNLTLEQLHNRNQYNKNWGNYKPFLFVKGQPRLTISLSALLYLISITLGLSIIAAFVSTVNKHKGDDERIYFCLFIIQSLAGALCILRLWSIDPGVSSSSLPILREEQLFNYYRYCRLCKIVTDPSKELKHCRDCNTCIKGSRFHSQLFGRCITPLNARCYYLCLGYLWLQPLLFCIIFTTPTSL